MTIGKKIVGLVLAALAGIVLLFGVSEYQVNRVYEAANYANVNTVPALIVLQDAVVPMALIRIDVWKHMHASDDAQRDKLEQDIGAHRRHLDEVLKRFEPLVSDEKDRALLDADHAALGEYDVVRGKVLTLSRQKKGDEARDLATANQVVVDKV